MLYCACGLAENLIKLHKAQLADDRTTHCSANGKQIALILDIAAYWLLRRFLAGDLKDCRSCKGRVYDPAPAVAQGCCPRHGKLHPLCVAFVSAFPDPDLLRAIIVALKPTPT